MLALGLVRAAQRHLFALEPVMLRACELLDRIDTPREGTARSDLRKIAAELSRALAEASFEGQPLFEGGSSMFDVEDSRQRGEPLKVTLPTLTALVSGEHGLERYLSKRRDRAESSSIAEALRAGLHDGKSLVREAAQQLSVLLSHFHRQRSDRLPGSAPDLASAAARLGERVVRAGHAALAAQGELSTRASSLVLNGRID